MPHARVRLGFDALCEANRPWYIGYAETWTADRAEARRCVKAALDALETRWVNVLGTPSPAACVWESLRTEAERLPAVGGSCAKQMHALLPGDEADILLLHQTLSLPLEQAAHLMGLAGPRAVALLRGAERRLAANPS
ncbi:hypothetical protein ACWGLE_18540 [Streptomyces sp. NPDC055897]